MRPDENLVFVLISDLSKYLETEVLWIILINDYDNHAKFSDCHFRHSL